MREEDKKPTFIAEVPAELPMEKELLRREELDRVIVGNENAEAELRQLYQHNKITVDCQICGQ